MIRWIVALFFLFNICAISPFLMIVESAPEYESLDFPEDAQYDVYYQASENEVQRMESVKIVGLKTIGKKDFLVVFRDQGLNSASKLSFIAMEAIKAIVYAAYSQIPLFKGFRRE